jgi:acetyl esterase/lipase
MFRPLALLIALAVTPALAAPAPSSSLDDTRIQSIVDTAQGTGRSSGGIPTFGASAGGSSRQTGVSGGTLSTGEHTLRYYRFTTDPGSGFAEKFFVFEPVPKPTSPRPLLVSFHAFGVTQNDILVNTSFMEECAKRGWYLLAPLSASGGHFMSQPGQINTRAALDLTLAGFNVDEQRIYGVGFSMGGGMALNFAARNLDPAGGMFAAVVDHTGAVDLNDTYRDDPSSQFIFDFWYGDGSPGTADPFQMLKASLFEYDDVAQQVDPDTDLARNLAHVPIYMLRAEFDPLVDLAEQHDRLYAILAGQGRPPGPAFTHEIVPSVDVHKWSTLDAAKACDWMAQFTLDLPSSGRTLAIKEGTHFHFFVDQQVVGGLTPITWEVDTVANRFVLSETENLNGIYLDTAGAGLSTSKVLYVTLSTADGAADRVGLRGFAKAPAGVMRDGVIVDGSYWSYDSNAKMVVLTETDGAGTHDWVVAP